MKRFGLSVTLLFSFVCAAAANSPEALRVGSITLRLGQTAHEVEGQLSKDVYLGWERDQLPGHARSKKTEHGVTYESSVKANGQTLRLRYSDEHGEHAFIAPRSSPNARIASLVFENGKLTRAMRLVGASDYRSASASALLDSVATTLKSWSQSGSSPITVSTTDVNEHGLRLREVVFSSGSKQLSLFEMNGSIQVVENLGRGDIPTVTSEP